MNNYLKSFSKYFSISTALLVSMSMVSISMVPISVQAECDSSVKATAPSDSFIDLEDGRIEDTRTGLVWSKCSSGQEWDSASNECYFVSNMPHGYLWQDALNYAQSLQVAGINHWRLPNKKELASIVEYACFEPAINTNVFPQTENAVYWTSTPLPYTQPLKVVTIDFTNGAFNSFNAESAEAKVRAVYSR